MIRDGVEVLPALTLRQPWAWAVFHAGKDIENRDNNTNFRGRVVVHAAAAKHETQELAYFKDAVQWMVSRGLARSDEWPALRSVHVSREQHERLIAIPHRDELPRGVILGTVDLVGVMAPEESAVWKMGGKHGYRIREPRETAHVEWKGLPGWFYVPASKVTDRDRLKLTTDLIRDGHAVLCAKCKRPVEHVDISRDRLTDRIEIHAWCHGKRAEKTLSLAELEAMNETQRWEVEVFA